MRYVSHISSVCVLSKIFYVEVLFRNEVHVLCNGILCNGPFFFKQTKFRLDFMWFRHYGRKLNSSPKFLFQTASTKFSPNSFSVVVPKTTFADLYVVAIYRIIWHNSRHEWCADRAVTAGKPRFGKEGADNGEEWRHASLQKMSSRSLRSLADIWRVFPKEESILIRLQLIVFIWNAREF